MDKKRVILFDWGDTLMREFPEFEGPMADWPRVEILPGVVETLTLLYPAWRYCIASNADVSTAPDIRRAMARVDLDRFFERVYCFKNVGFKKPDRKYFDYILNDLGIKSSQAVMVGDSFSNDVLGANAAGICGIWFNWRSNEEQDSPLHHTIHQFDHLPSILGRLFPLMAE
jgi:putative hydrolase of the HAD superfamily